ncbi:MAG: lectin MOA-related protein [Pseudomonadota bacterium]
MVETVTRTKLAQFATSTMRDHKGNVTKLRVSDQTMELPTGTLFRQIIDDIKPEMPKKAEYSGLNLFDCDDYSFIFKGLISQWYRHNRRTELPFAIGIAWGFFSSFSPQEFHSLNFVFLGDDRILRWIEPQMIREETIEKATAKYKPAHDKVSLLIL